MASTAKAIHEVLTDFYAKYKSKTPQRLKLVDAYLAYVMITGIILFVYCCIVGTFPFNSFLAGFISCVGSFVLAGNCVHMWCSLIRSCNSTLLVCFRIQTNPENRKHFKGISPERAFGDFIFASVVLHLVVMNFIG